MLYFFFFGKLLLLIPSGRYGIILYGMTFLYCQVGMHTNIGGNILTSDTLLLCYVPTLDKARYHSLSAFETIPFGMFRSTFGTS